MNKIRLGILAIACMTFCAHSSFAQQWGPKRIVGMDYPALARAARIQGQVKVVCTLKPDGSVASTSVTEDPHPMLANAARQNASNWIFMAVSVSGQLPETITLVYSFKMEGRVAQPLDSTSPHQPARQFVFEYPSSVKISSEYCPLESSCF